MFMESLKLHLENENIIMGQRGFGEKKLRQPILITFLNWIMVGLDRGKPGRHFIDGISGKLSARSHMMDYCAKPPKYGLGDECFRWLRNCLEDKNGGIQSAFCSPKLRSFMGVLPSASAGFVSGLSGEVEAHRTLHWELCAFLLIIPVVLEYGRGAFSQASEPEGSLVQNHRDRAVLGCVLDLPGGQLVQVSSARCIAGWAECSQESICRLAARSMTAVKWWRFQWNSTFFINSGKSTWKGNSSCQRMS